jgi:hypothetical protein
MNHLVKQSPVVLQNALKLASSSDMQLSNKLSTTVSTKFNSPVHKVAYSIAYPKKFLNLFPTTAAERGQTILQYNTMNVASKEIQRKLRQVQKKENIPPINTLQIQYGQPFPQDSIQQTTVTSTTPPAPPKTEPTVVAPNELKMQVADPLQQTEQQNPETSS